ncbi:palmitoyltransferase ZDHHC20-B-like [Haemaphysalis longicornis]
MTKVTPETTTMAQLMHVTNSSLWQALHSAPACSASALALSQTTAASGSRGGCNGVAVTAMATFGWSYYAYVFVFCGKYVKEQALYVVFIMVYHLLLFFCLWPYAMTTFTSPAPVPQSFHFSTDERRALESCANSPTRKTAVLEAMADKRGVLTRSSGGLVAHCDRCQCIKPDRCHHCSKCQRCITKMDHHCPWFNNCVSFRTYKYFLLTLFYIVLLGAYASLSTSFYLWHSNPRRSLLELSLHIPFLVIVGAAVAIAMGRFLGTHLVFVARNRSTIESMQAPEFREDGDSFDLGVRRNFVEVFGTNTALWPLPVKTSLGDGVRFPTRLHPDKPVSSSTPERAMTPEDEGTARAHAASTTSNDISYRTHGTTTNDNKNVSIVEMVAIDSASAGEGVTGSHGSNLAISLAPATYRAIRSESKMTAGTPDLLA